MTQYFTTKQASEYLKSLGLRIGAGTLNNYIKEGKIVIVRISKNKRYITDQALEDFIHKNTGVYKQ